MVDAAQGGRFAHGGSYTIAESGISVVTRHGVAFTPNGGGYGRGVSFPTLPTTPDITTCTVFVPFSNGVSGFLTNVVGGSGEVPSRVELLASGQIKATQGQDTTSGVITHQDSVRLQQLNVAIYTNRHTASGASQTLWLNGVKASTTTASSAQSGFNANSQFACYNLSSSRQVGLLISAVWNRILADAEIRALSANPWLLLKPSQSIALLKALAAGGTLNASAAGADTASGAADLTAQVGLAGVGVSVAGASAQTSVAIPLSAAGFAVADGLAGPQATITLGASGLAVAAAAAGLSSSVLLSAAAAAQAAGNAALATQLNVLAAGAAQAGGSASLAGSAPGSLAATGQGMANGGAVLSVQVRLQAAGAAQANGTAAGQASAPGQLAAFGQGHAGGWSAQSVLINLSAAGFVQAMGQGALSIDVPLGAHGVANAAGLAQLGVAGPVRGARLEPSAPHLMTQAVAVAYAATSFEHGAEHV